MYSQILSQHLYTSVYPWILMASIDQAISKRPPSAPSTTTTRSTTCGIKMSSSTYIDKPKPVTNWIYHQTVKILGQSSLFCRHPRCSPLLFPVLPRRYGRGLLLWWLPKYSNKVTFRYSTSPLNAHVSRPTGPSKPPTHSPLLYHNPHQKILGVPWLTHKQTN